MKAVNNGHLNTNAFEPTTSHEIFYSVNNAHQYSLNTIASEPTTSMPQSLYSGPFSTALATSVDFLGPKKTLFDSAYLPLNELQNGQLKPTKFAQDMELPTKCLVCGHPTTCWMQNVFSSRSSRIQDIHMQTQWNVQHNNRHLGWRIWGGVYDNLPQINYQQSLILLPLITSTISGANQCRACRFDRCVLAGMNPRLMQFPTSVDVVKFSDKVANRRRYLSQKYGERCPVLIGKTGPVFKETIEDKIIQSLVYVELKVKKIRESSRWLSESVIFRGILDILESNQENVLAQADQYPKALNWPLTFDEALMVEAIDRRPKWLMLDTFLCIEMARTMPVFPQLDYNDQVALLKHAVLANALLLEAFYSCQMKSETLIMPTGCLPAVPPKGYRSNRITDTMKLICCRTMEAISRIQMTMEEFVLLKAVIYSHSAIHGLSERGRVLLEKECIRYSKTLMKHLQSRMGAAPGAKKYAEIISFVGCLFHGAQRIREVHKYVSTTVRQPGIPPFWDPPYMQTIMYAYFI
ncbi:ligand-binding domain of nuclear hormone receptor domain-containing protein [Ditylenchus destructor]|nr:ligand-binding domain of nuclear hormone receptor domain-containing protein [Ditylenchus destructor]